MSLYLFALLIGVVAGLRAMTAPAAVRLGRAPGPDPAPGHALAWLGGNIAVGVFTVLAVLELVSDQPPKTPSRKVPRCSFGARVVSGAFCGAAVGDDRERLDRRGRRRRDRGGDRAPG